MEENIYSDEINQKLMNSPLTELPTELVYQILLKMEVNDILQFCSSSTEMQKFCQNHYIWTKLIERDHGLTYKEIKDRFGNENLSWIEIYQTLANETKHINLVEITDGSVYQANANLETKMKDPMSGRMQIVKYPIESSTNIKISQITVLHDILDAEGSALFKEYISKHYDHILHGFSPLSLVKFITAYKMISADNKVYMVFKVLEISDFVNVNHYFIYSYDEDSLHQSYNLSDPTVGKFDRQRRASDRSSTTRPKLRDFLNVAPNIIISIGFVDQELYRLLMQKKKYEIR